LLISAASTAPAAPMPTMTTSVFSVAMADALPEMPFVVFLPNQRSAPIDILTRTAALRNPHALAVRLGYALPSERQRP
jgi:hypothetical protein